MSHTSETRSKLEKRGKRRRTESSDSLEFKQALYCQILRDSIERWFEISYTMTAKWIGFLGLTERVLLVGNKGLNSGSIRKVLFLQCGVVKICGSSGTSADFLPQTLLAQPILPISDLVTIDETERIARYGGVQQKKTNEWASERANERMKELNERANKRMKERCG